MLHAFACFSDPHTCLSHPPSHLHEGDTPASLSFKSSLTHLAHGQLIMVGTHPLPHCYAMKRLCHCTQVPLESMPQQLLSVRGRRFYSVSFQYPTVSGVEPVVTNQTFWLESTDSCDMPQKQACGASEISNTPIPSATKSQYMQLLGA